MVTGRRAETSAGSGRERGAGALEYLGVVVVVALLVAGLVTAVVRFDLGTQVACRLQAVVSQAGTCGGPEVPTVYDAGGPDDGAPQAQRPGAGGAEVSGDGAGAGQDALSDATRYANATGTSDPVDEERVADALDDLRDALQGGWFGVRGGDLRDAMTAVQNLSGPELDALVAQMSDDELRAWVDELDDGWWGGGWDRGERRELWELFASSADKVTLDRLATFTDELQPSFSGVGGDGARDDPSSPANVAEYGELDHELFVGTASATDVSQGYIGDCWYMMSMMAVAQADPDVIREAITVNANGTYTVRLYPDGQAVDVTVTPEMVLMPDGSPAFAANDGGDPPYELWPMVLEKALALQYGDYEDIEGGWPKDGLTLLTGRASQSHDVDELGISELAQVLDDGGAVGLSSLTTGDAKTSPYYQSDKGDDRLHANHAYYLQSVDVSNGTVTVVNPWGIAGYPPITMAYDDFVRAFRQVDTNEVS
ncbi:C2 family cysteine protease [Cellulomonas soli]|uniref:C2 family cysteine protease n=1 Tax=Cellulomonas soli TaxID=931535 RepID=UPI003F8257A9